MAQTVEQMQERALVRRPSPGERALARARALLEVMRTRLTAREREMEELRAEYEAFERRYHARVGVHVAELERLEAEVAGATARLHDDAGPPVTAARARRGALVATPFEADRARAAARGDGDLRTLYRAVARRLHPDFAADERDRERRTRLMAEANRAYAEGDAACLQALLDDWDVAPDTRTDDGVAAAIARVERAIARVVERLRAVAAEAVTIRRSELWLLRAEAAELARQGRDFLAELADEQQAGIALARKQLAALACRLHDRFGPRPERVLRFPEARALGTLFVRPRGEGAGGRWEELGAARDPLTVPAEMDARLLVRRRADLAALAALGPDDLQALDLAKTGVSNATLPALGALTGLRDLDLSCNEIADAGLGQLAALSGLRRLDLSYCFIDGEGLAALDGLGALEHLSLAGPSLTDAAVARLGAFPLLRELDLAHSGVTDACLPHLAALTGLRRLNLAGSAVSHAGLAALRRALPGCAIAGGREALRSRHADSVRTLTELVAGR